MDYKTIIQQIKTSTKKPFKAKVNDDNKLINIVANYGLSRGGIAIRNKGEYNGFALTDRRIIRVIKALSKNDIHKAINILNINQEIQENINILYEILCLWLEKNDIEIPTEFSNKRCHINQFTIKKMGYKY